VVPYVRGEAAGAPEHRAAPRVTFGVSIALLAAGGSARRSCRTGSSRRCARPSTSSACPRPSPGSWSSPFAGNAVENVVGWCSRARASPTWRSRWSRTRSRRWPPSCTRRSCSSRCSSPTS
jgi:hypothetical protein